MTGLASLLEAFRAASGCEATVWNETGGQVTRIASTSGASRPKRLPALADGPLEVSTKHGPALVAAIPGLTPAWVLVGPSPTGAPLDANLRMLVAMLGEQLQAALEVEHAAGELAERYEEINLLYTISEILGRTVNLEEAAKRILAEISDTVGARKAAMQVYDPSTRSLVAVAALGAAPGSVAPISIDDVSAVSVRAFRECRAEIVGDGEMPSAAETSFRSGAMLSVPIMWTTPNAEPEPLGVVNLSDRRAGQPFTAGDQKLMSAIATQIATAIQNARLVRESLTQQRLAQEMELAHDLQMRLLPEASSVAPTANVAARVVPAESVGGDLYNLFRLGPGKTGVMVGDVSGHGYQAALIMALAMSASAIHAQTTVDPGETLGALLTTLRHELAESEMFISMFYGVVDRVAGRLRYANAGHPHAFVISRRGIPERLAAIDPPLGMGKTVPTGAARPWGNEDLLLLFTDGVSDARNAAGTRLGEDRVLQLAKQYRDEPPARILEHLFQAIDEHTAGATRRDDLTIVVMRS